MQILSLHIYQYGKFSNQTFHFSTSGVQLIYGLNEAGKTTMMSFIESMLFGFPKTKKYEPKTGGVYGGILEAEHHEYGRIKVERTKGVSGRVRVYTAAGEVKTEDFLKKLLRNTDRALYKSIYSFDVFGLQEIHTFNRDKIGEFLLFSSLFGAEAVTKLDSRLAKEQDRLYKPNGRNPRLNQELETLKQLTAKLKQAESLEAGYHSLLEEKKALASSLADAETELTGLTEHIRHIDAAIHIKPLIDQKTALQQKMEAYPAQSARFPADGLYQLEKYESHIHPKSAQLEALRVKAAELSSQSQQLMPNEEMLKNEALIQNLLAEYHMYQSYGEQLSAVQAQLRQVSSRVSSGLQQLGKTDEKELLHMNTAYDYEWQLQQAMQSYGQARDRKKQLDETFEQARRDLEEAERAYEESAAAVLNDHQRKEKEAELKKQGFYQGQEELASQLMLLEKQQAKQKKIILGAGALCTAFFLIVKEWLPAIAFAAAVLIYLFVTFKKAPAIRMTAQRSQQKTNVFSGEMDELKEALWQDDQNRQQLITLKAVLQQKEAGYERVIQQFEEWEAEMAPAQSRIESYKKDLGFSEDASFLLDAYSLMKDLKNEIKKKHELTIEAGRLQKHRRTFEERLNQLMPSENGDEHTVADLIHFLKKSVEREEKIEKQKREIDTEIQYAEEQMRDLDQEIQYFQAQIDQLFHAAGANDREDFRAIAEIGKKRKETEEQLQNIKAQLHGAHSDATELAGSGTLSEMKRKLSEAKERRDRLHEDVHHSREQLALLAVRQEQLEASGTVSELKLQTEMQKERVKSLAKEWAAIQIVRQVIKDKMERHKKVGLPRLLETAKAFFHPLTGGSYENIYFSETDDSIMVMRSDGMTFHAEELSQATCEQLYASIRFALALTRQDGVMLPFQLDDSFVHFDQERLKRVLEVLARFSEGNRQILYFTCHEHVKVSFPNDQVIHLLS
ncbi:ATP-binding protein [Bacillus atrophaeus]|uniref:ATP-binding protein n=1 Tax=Bacillus atrophaeus TaxID=1452 RepID=UPI002DB6C417|nr:AAA family ATPase [Bacillus atrophaeus]MEC0805679.1 AAA family ATPase [Bacillus atrophaeus]MEC0853594.1 AAA family ATPase [Bacillus atrophaeus]MEC0856721.1 AAA family ATPase [Bacillus atrophaeus]MEC0863313.1 AAA family ATPase [Bacillus atrophaeus]MEC0869589.1 AAA family ATPase [Bacillus atrophaeus]